MSKNNKKYRLWIGLAFVSLTIMLMVIVVVNAMRGDSSGDLKIGGESKVTGLVCKDTELMHPALDNIPALSHTNTVTASFRGDNLSSLSLVYEGEYDTERKARDAETFGTARYNLILTDDYHEKIDIFSSNFSSNERTMQLVQTVRDIGRVNRNTVTYFLLDQGTNISRSLDGLKKQYDAKGFSCEISD